MIGRSVEIRCDQEQRVKNSDHPAECVRAPLEKGELGHGLEGALWKRSQNEDEEEEAIMLAIDIGMEMPLVEVPRVPTEDR